MSIEVDNIQKSRKKYYTVTDLVKTGIIPWARDNRTLIKIIESDLEANGVLQAQIQGTEKYRRYLVQKNNLIKYLKIHGPALMVTVRKTKWNKQTKKQQQS